MSCETCGREIKNYGIFLGGIRCPNYCEKETMKLIRHTFEIKFEGHSKAEIVVFVPKFTGLSGDFSQTDLWLLAARKAGAYNGRVSSILLKEEKEIAMAIQTEE